MYLGYFGLEKPPFGITPDTSLFFNGAERGDVLQALLYAINSGEGIVKVIGEVGSGKTMLSRMLAKTVPNNIDLVFLLNPRIKAEEVLYAIALDLGLKIDGNSTSLEVLHLLQRQLLNHFNQGKKVVLIIDEAQQMPLATLEEIRLLSNLETETEKLLQIVLLGQPELDNHLNTPQIRQLKERISYSFYLSPLNWQVAKEYLDFRLQKAGNQGRDLFSPSAIRLMSKLSAGTLRRLNMLADKSLLSAFLEGKPIVEPRHVRVALKDGNREIKNGKGFSLLAISILIACVVSTILIFINFSSPASNTIKKDSVEGLAAYESREQIKGKNGSAVNDSKDDALRGPEVLRMGEQPIVNQNQGVEGLADRPDSIREPLLESRMESFLRWEHQGASGYTIRLLSAPGQRGASVEHFLQGVQKENLLDNTYITRLNTSNRDLVVYFGHYSGYSEAASALEAMPEALKKFAPYITPTP